MDRRDFLKTTGAAAATVAAGTATASADGALPVAPPPAPAVVSGAVSLRLASAWSADLPGLGTERLARRIETATGGRYRIDVGAGLDAGADLQFATAHEFTRLHPAFAYFAGLPVGQGGDAATQQLWLGVGGGQMLWDELAAGFGLKPLLAGHTGPSAGLWSNRRFDRVADFAGARLTVTGLARDIVHALGGEAVEVVPHDVQASLADGRIDGAEWLGPLAAVSPGLQPLAERLMTPGLNDAGTALALMVRKGLWDSMSAADQAIFEACAAEAYQTSLAENGALRLIEAQVEMPAKWPVRQALSVELAAALRAAASDAVERIAAADEAARRIHDSHQAFRAMLEAPRTA